jgi:hypothetical protein
VLLLLLLLGQLLLLGLLLLLRCGAAVGDAMHPQTRRVGSCLGRSVAQRQHGATRGSQQTHPIP